MRISIDVAPERFAMLQLAALHARDSAGNKQTVSEMVNGWIGQHLGPPCTVCGLPRTLTDAPVIFNGEQVSPYMRGWVAARCDTVGCAAFNTTTMLSAVEGEPVAISENGAGSMPIQKEKRPSHRGRVKSARIKPSEVKNEEKKSTRPSAKRGGDTRAIVFFTPTSDVVHLVSNCAPLNRYGKAGVVGKRMTKAQLDAARDAGKVCGLCLIRTR